MLEAADVRQIVEYLTDPRPYPQRLRSLVGNFLADSEAYRSTAYKEMALRSDFLNPLLEELGWDPLNTAYSPYADREVVQEDAVTVDGGQKAPDYAFLVGGKRRFFMEAKRPSVNISTDRAPAYQLRRYCWTAGLPYGVVTDFEEFAIYDCRRPPAPDDSTAVGRVAYFTIDELEENWAFFDGMFGRHNVVQGMLDLLASEAPAPSGTRAIDTAFLDEIRKWRQTLAAEVAPANPQLAGLEVSAAVQTLIDRIVFLRIAEARGIEPTGELNRAVGTATGVYSQLLMLFKRADDRYNSGLFRLHGDDPQVDTIGLTLSVPDGVLRKIIARLYYPEPYEFSVMPADILGRIYEQFLGERIVVAPNRSVTVELKPEHRKSGGVYYTPTPIVDYIVEETLGPLLKGQDPARLKRERFAVVDPASGSGSFLIAAFQHLLDWHQDQWASQPKNRTKYLEVGADGRTRVKTSERNRILLDYVYGVDIDPQAVEVTKLSLLLKVIENQAQQELDLGRILPDLDNNIVCGNSLIDHDFPLPMGLSREEELAYNPFSWSKAFPKVFARGGFDAVIGNPPYLNVDATWGRKDPRLAYLKTAYADVYSDKTDLLFYFLQKASTISRGESAFIVSRSFLEADKARKLRGWLATNVKIRAVLDFRHAIVFPKVGINTAIVRMTRSTAVKETIFSRFIGTQLRAGYDAAYLRQPENLAEVQVASASLSSGPWNFGRPEVEAVLAKLDKAGTPVGEVLHVGKGMETGANAAFRFESSTARLAELAAQGLVYERARNSDIHANHISRSGVHLLYVEDAEGFGKLPQDVRDHLDSKRDVLEARAAFRRGNCEWWRYTWPLHRNYFNRARILCPYRASTNRFALDAERAFLGITDTTVLYDNDQPEDLRYIVGLLNTRILTARFRFIGKLLGGGVYEYYENTISKLPIPRSTPGNAAYDEIVTLVRYLEDATSVTHSSLITDEVEAARGRIAEATDRIEEIAASLFGLSAEDRALLDEQLE